MARQIDSTPNCWRCWSTKALGLDAAVELRLGEKRAGQPDLVGLAQFAHLSLQLFDALDFKRRDALTLAVIDLMLADPGVQSVCGTQPILLEMDSMAAHCDGCS